MQTFWNAFLLVLCSAAITLGVLLLLAGFWAAQPLTGAIGIVLIAVGADATYETLGPKR